MSTDRAGTAADRTAPGGAASAPVPTWRVAPGWAGLATGAALASAAAGLATPALVGRAVGTLAGGGAIGTAVLPLAVLLVAAVIANVTASLADGAYTAAVTARIRAHAARRVIEGSGTAEPDPADVATRLLVDARQPAAARGITTGIVIAAASLGFGLFALALIDWWLLAGLLGALLALMVLLRRFVVDTTPLLERYREAQSQVAAGLLDAQRGAASIRAHGTWRRELTRVLGPLPAVHAAGAALWSAQRRFAWRTSVFVPAAQLITVAVGGASLAAGRIGVGAFAAAIGYTGVVLGALDGIETAAGLNVVRVGRRRLATLLGSPAPRRREDAPPAGAAPEIVLDEVTVLRDGRPVLDRISAVIPAGSCVAITGASASGRSTLAAVIGGVVVPDGGEVRIGDVPLDGLGPVERRRLVTLAAARPPLLGDTVAGLLGLGLDRPDRSRLAAAARSARVAEVIESLPLGYDTPVSTLRLSGGEAQRLGIAQALARDSAVLVLDDATTGLDVATEREVVRALLAARAGRTCVLVTDRPAVIRRADTVIHLDAGRRADVPFVLDPTSTPSFAPAAASR